MVSAVDAVCVCVSQGRGLGFQWWLEVGDGFHGKVWVLSVMAYGSWFRYGHGLDGFQNGFGPLFHGTTWHSCGAYLSFSVTKLDGWCYWGLLQTDCIA